MKQRDIGQEELEREVVRPAYRTTDFEFVATALAYKKPEVKLVQLEAVQNDGSNRTKYVFVLVGKEPGADVREELNALSRAYVNEELLIEPLNWLAIRSNLRAHMLNTNREKQQLNRNPNRGGGRSRDEK